MHEWHRATRITPHALRVLAALLLADGNYVSTRQLAKALPDDRVQTPAIRKHITTLRRFGVPWIEVRQGRGYRLQVLPPDWLLEDVLAMTHRVKSERPRERWGRTRLVAVRAEATRSVRRSSAIETRFSAAGVSANSR